LQSSNRSRRFETGITRRWHYKTDNHALFMDSEIMKVSSWWLLERDK
jgi:hypothetical protein